MEIINYSVSHCGAVWNFFEGIEKSISDILLKLPLVMLSFLKFDSSLVSITCLPSGTLTL